MSSPIITVENLGKSYLVGHQSAQAERYTALRDVLGRTVKNFGRKALDMARGKQIVQGDEVEEFWALKDVSFEVQPGDVVGVIGNNGAGKSTLLKVLSRITEPSAGKVTLGGRVASLLEVGTGFHPELTGRENIFLNGAILGMTRAEIKRKFDEIVAFAEVENFLDTPVKRYSSGMYVRLAFSVAAHLEPEILVVDEVLAVGDMSFQKKCLNKMSEVSGEGRTILFVSHNLSAIRRLCTQGVLLGNGEVRAGGEIESVVQTYLNDGSNCLPVFKQENCADKSVTLTSAVVSDIDDVAANEFGYNDELKVVIEFEVNSTVRDVNIWTGIRTIEDIWVFGTSDTDVQTGELGCNRSPGRYRTRFTIPKNYLNAGRFSAVIGISHGPSKTIYDRVELPYFSVSEVDVPELGRPGVVAPLIPWNTEVLG